MKRLKLAVILSALLAITIALLWLWLADRATDVPAPARNGLVFNPEFGPKTPTEAKGYVQKRVQKRWRGMFNKEMELVDLDSGWGKQLHSEAVETLKERWWITLNMTQEEIDTVREEARVTWAYPQQSRTLRHKTRSFLGMAN